MEILIVDDNETTLDLVEMYIESFFDLTPNSASSGNAAIKLLKEGFNPSLILSDYNMPDGSGADLFSFYEKEKLDCCFALLSAEPFDLLDEFKSIHNPTSFVYLQKPYNGQEFLDAIEPFVRKAKNLDNIVRPEYMKVKIEKFMRYINCSVDVFLRLSEKKYVKVSNRVDKASSDQLERFQAKGENHIYLSFEDFQLFIETGMDNANKDLKNQSGVKLVSVQSNAIESIHEAMKHLGVSSKAIETAGNCFEATLSTLQKNESIKELLPSFKKGDDNFKYSLSIASSYFSVAMGLKASFCDTSNLEKLAMAALFQDFGLDEPKLLRITSMNSDEYKVLSKNEKNLIKEHPQKAIELLDKSIDLPVDVKNIISQHHERPGEEGFPRGLGASAITPLSCIFILSHELSNKILSEDSIESNLDLIRANFESRYNTGNFKKVFDSFSSVFTKLK